MIVHGCIEIHPKDCGWIIVTGFRVLLISQHLFPEILLEAVLGVHTCQNKKYLYLDVLMIHLLHKGFMENYLC
jgi:hypothetical protein